MSAAPRVSVCVATFRRPNGLERLLRSLNDLVLEGDPLPEVEVVVVDNDPEGSAAELCERLRPRLRWPLRYVPEPQRGISFARNRAVRAARDRADFIAFIDDDEVPDPRWMSELLRVQREHGADVVTGPVVPSYEGPAPDWVEEGKFFHHPRYRTGDRIPYAATNNVLFHVRVLEGLDPIFDPRFALTGGEDIHFFLRVVRAGHRIVWADDAVVHDWIPESRLKAAWVLRRSYRIGTNWASFARELRSWPGVAVHTAKGVARIAHGMALLPLGLLLGKRMLVRSGEQICEGVGNLVGLAGVSHQEYRKIHGS